MMITATTQPSANSYWNMVKHLSPEVKLDLIAMLSQSLKADTPHRVYAKEYYGIWGDDGMTDEEFVDELKSMRTFNRPLQMV